MKKRNKFVICLLIILFTLGVIVFAKREKDYIYSYEIDSYKIFEKYQKELKAYYFIASKDTKTYEIALNNKFVSKKGLIKSVKELIDDNMNCVYMKSDILNTYPICMKDNSYIAYLSLLDESFFKLKKYQSVVDQFGNIKIQSLTNRAIAIWNHFGYDYIQDGNKETITALKKESYLDNYSFMVDEYIILPDYDSEYSFNKAYIINLKTGNLTKWDFEYNISYDFYCLGIYDHRAYIVDKKEQVEYEIEPRKKKITIISKNGIGKIWNNKWEEESIVKLSNANYKFNDKSFINYKIKDKKLVASFTDGQHEIVITDKEVDRIVKYDDLEVYYISKNKLYYFSFNSGEVECLEYSELEFNKGLSIYIY